MKLSKKQQYIKKATLREKCFTGNTRITSVLNQVKANIAVKTQRKKRLRIILFMAAFILTYIFYINRQTKVVKLSMFIKRIGTVQR